MNKSEKLKEYFVQYPFFAKYSLQTPSSFVFLYFKPIGSGNL